jgi:hypothetical protein
MKTLLFALFVFTIFSAAGQKKTYTPFTDNGIADKEALSALTADTKEILLHYPALIKSLLPKFIKNGLA